MKQSIKWDISLNAKVLTAAVLFMFLMGTFLNGNFLTVSNFLSICQQMSEIGILALGLTLVIITGGIDISIGSIMGLCATVTGFCMAKGMPIFAALVCSLLVSLLCGLLNAFMVAVIKVPAMIATLGTQMLFYGMALGLSEGNSISQIPQQFYFLGQGKIAGIPVQALVLVALTAGVAVLLKKYRFGRRLFAIGNNEKVSLYSGIKTVKVLFGVYVICAVLCCIAGNIQVARVATARADMGSTYLMECLSAVVLGGTSISGGKGNVIGTIVGVFIFTLISNIMNLVGISAFWQQFTTGVVLILVVVFNKVTESNLSARRSISVKNAQSI
ncbi:MAG: ABC transporter permease [Blautia sp.]|jgi:ribose/xylose/arabinose/galactoside ABC-type transport system permease subunit